MIKKKVLIVDDEENIQYIIKALLAPAGYDMYSASDAKEALKITDREHIEVFFLDLKLPDINGISLGKKIKKKNPLSCIYGMTAYPALYTIAGCREAGFDDYFCKPFDTAMLFKAAHDGFEKIDRWKKTMQEGS